MSGGGTILETYKVTEQERQHVDIAGNLSDAQVYLPLTAAQVVALPGPDFFTAPRTRIDIGDLKVRFRDAFAAFHGGLDLPPAEEWFHCYSASGAIEIACNVLRLAGAERVGLLHPTFDATYHILRRHGVSPVAVPDEVLTGPEADLAQSLRGLDALVLTLPNNPTGRDMSEAGFTALARAARASGTALVIDACFRAYRADPVPHHAILRAAGTDAVVIEDTGKLFYLKDIKLGLAWCSGSLRAAFYEIHCDFLLDTPLHTLECLTRLLEVSGPAHARALRAAVARNRARARRALAPLVAEAIGTAHSNIQLFRLSEGPAAAALAARMARDGVGIVDANPFFWRDRDSEYIRLALTRVPEEFDRHLSAVAARLAVRPSCRGTSPAG